MSSVPIQIQTGGSAARRDAAANEGQPASRSLEDCASDTADFWLLCAVVCSGKGLYVGNNTLGDLFCMLHTSDGSVRSRTVSPPLPSSPISLPHCEPLPSTHCPRSPFVHLPPRLRYPPRCITFISLP